MRCKIQDAESIVYDPDTVNPDTQGLVAIRSFWAMMSDFCVLNDISVIQRICSWLSTTNISDSFTCCLEGFLNSRKCTFVNWKLLGTYRHIMPFLKLVKHSILCEVVPMTILLQILHVWTDRNLQRMSLIVFSAFFIVVLYCTRWFNVCVPSRHLKWYLCSCPLCSEMGVPCTDRNSSASTHTIFCNVFTT